MSSGKDLLSLDWGRILSISLSTAQEPPNSATSSASARVPIGLLGAVGSDFDPWFNNQAQVAPLRPLLGKTQAALDSLFPPVSVPDVAKRKKKGKKDTHPCTSQHACRWKCDTEHCIRTLSDCDSVSRGCSNRRANLSSHSRSLFFFLPQ